MEPTQHTARSRAFWFPLTLAVDVVSTAAVGLGATIGVLGEVWVGSQALREVGPWLNGAAALLALRLLVLRGAPFGAERLRGPLTRAVERLAAGAAWLSDRRLALPLVALLSVVLKIALAIRYPGFYSGDDLEPLQMARNWVDGESVPISPIRSPLHPAVAVAPLLASLRTLGWDGPDAVVFAGRASGVLFSTLNLFLLSRLARRFLGSRRLGDLATAMLALSGIAISFGSGAFPRTFSTTLVLASAVFFFDSEGRPAGPVRLFAAGTLLAAAFPVRYSEVSFLLPAGAVLLWEVWREPRTGLPWARIAAFAAGFAGAFALICGGLDALYWGKPFSSLVAFVEHARAAAERGEWPRGEQPFYWYFAEFRTFLSLPALLLLVMAHRERAVRQLLLWFWLPVLALSLLPHKETRFLLPTLPFYAILLAAGASLLAGARGAKLATIAVMLVIALQSDGRLHVVRDGSHGAIRAARELGPRVAGRVITDGIWEYGEDLYFKDLVSIADAPGERLAERLADPQVEWVVLQERTLRRRPELEPAVREAGFHPARSYEGARAWRRSSVQPSPRGP